MSEKFNSSVHFECANTRTHTHSMLITFSLFQLHVFDFSLFLSQFVIFRSLSLSLIFFTHSQRLNRLYRFCFWVYPSSYCAFCLPLKSNVQLIIVHSCIALTIWFKFFIEAIEKKNEFKRSKKGEEKPNRILSQMDYDSFSNELIILPAQCNFLLFYEQRSKTKNAKQQWRIISNAFFGNNFAHCLIARNNSLRLASW